MKNKPIAQIGTYSIELKYLPGDGKYMPFPVVYIALDVDSVVYLTIIPDTILHSIDGGFIVLKDALSKILRIDFFTQERDISLRNTELFGSLSLWREKPSGMV